MLVACSAHLLTSAPLHIRAPLQNFMDLPKIKVPLILGIWGGKGQGKTFQCNLAYKKLGIAPIVMSAGEQAQHAPHAGRLGYCVHALLQRRRPTVLRAAPPPCTVA